MGAGALVHSVCILGGWEGGWAVNHRSAYLHESISTHTTMQPIH